MKIDLRDLFDNYSDPNLDIPDAYAVRNGEAGAGTARHAPQPRTKRPLLIAAAFLLVVTAATATPFVLTRTVGARTMNQSAVPTERVIEAIPPNISAAISGDSSQTTGAEVQTAISPQVLQGELDMIGSYGNLLYVDDCYYTLTDNGPEAIEMQNLNTTVTCHGTANLNMDYAVIDGTLAFRNLNSVRDSDAVRISPVAGSGDTVRLEIVRSDAEFVDNGRYPFFYNIFTGEITDPLSNVPNLFLYGEIYSIQFNSSLTRALVRVCPPTDSDVITYVCDLMSGEMQVITELLEPYFPEPKNNGAIFSDAGTALWADDDTVLIWEREAIPPGDGETELDWEYHRWMLSYNIAIGELDYKLRDAGAYTQAVLDFNQRYIYGHNDAGTELLMIDTASGEIYSLEAPFGLRGETTGDTRTVLWCEDGSLYLIDPAQPAWVRFNNYIVLPTEDILSVKLIRDNWLYLETVERVYFYHIPDDLPTTLWPTK